MHDQEAGPAPVVVRLPAQIDFARQDRAYGRLYAAFEAGAVTVIADFSATDFCDCSSLRRLVAVQHQAASRGSELRLVIPPGSPVHWAAELMDLDHLLPLFCDLREAAAAIPLPRRDGPARALD